MKHSETTISDFLNQIYLMNEEIENTILIGEKVAYIEDAGAVYNQLKSLITPEYLTNEEFEFLRKIAAGWNQTTKEYSNGQAVEVPNDEKSTEDIQKALKEAIDNLMDDIEDYQQDREGFDGGDGIY